MTLAGLMLMLMLEKDQDCQYIWLDIGRQGGAVSAIEKLRKQ
jgi:hypothetical protein